MAVAPFNIDESKPADADIVAQYPANERTNRDIIESALAIEHDMGAASANKTGHHKFNIGNNAARDAITNWNVGAIWFNTEGGNTLAPHMQIVTSVGPVVWSYVGDRPGTITAYGSITIPPGYSRCDGAAISRTTNNVLFGIIGTTYGAGDGSTTFNKPNYIDKYIVGRGATVIGGTVGSNTHTNTLTELAAHTHADTFAIASSGAHTHDVTHSDNTGGSAGSNLAGNNQPLNATAVNAALSDGAHTHTITGSVSSAGSGAAYNIQPASQASEIMIRL